MTNQRLSPLVFLPPPSSTPWTGATDQLVHDEIQCRSGTRPMKLPLFWHDPQWYVMPIEQADHLAVIMSELGVLVSALRSDLSPPDGHSQFHDGKRQETIAGDGEEGSSDGEEPEAAEVVPRIVPYRPERYGLSANDFDGATVLDVRLTMSRDHSGRFAFSPEQIRRWEATPSGEPLAGGGWVPAATFPPDVISMRHVSRKLDQLRELSDGTATFVTIGPYRLSEDLSRVLAAKPDGVILEMRDAQISGLQLAKLTQRARQEIDEAGLPEMPLWIAPGEISADDIAKLIELGASAVAIDSWCEALIQEAEQATATASVSRSRDYARDDSIDPKYLRELANYRLGPMIERVIGLGLSLGRVTKSQRLGSFDPQWANELGIEAVGV